MVAVTYIRSVISTFALMKVTTGLALTYPEVIPGPGLPSLAELGLTSEGLYKMGIPSSSSLPFSARYDPRCGPDGAYVNVNDIIACYHYLDNLGSQPCVISSGGVAHFCQAGNGEIIGTGPGGVSSRCSDVAYAVLYTVDHCTRPDQSVAGSQAAYGNGNLIVQSGHR